MAKILPLIFFLLMTSFAVSKKKPNLGQVLKELKEFLSENEDKYSKQQDILKEFLDKRDSTTDDEAQAKEIFNDLIEKLKSDADDDVLQKVDDLKTAVEGVDGKDLTDTLKDFDKVDEEEEPKKDEEGSGDEKEDKKDADADAEAEEEKKKDDEVVV